jgi:ferredoxin
MLIDKEKCVGCGNCVPVCAMGVISVVNGRSQVNQDECVECNSCYRTLRSEGLSPTFVRAVRWVLRLFHLEYDAPPDVCPTGALTPPKLEWPRVLRSEFSDPTVKHSSTGLGGRGTEEIKCNDVTGRLKEGEIGFAVELGRPGLGARFLDLQKVAMALAKAGVFFEPKNPVTHLMTDTKTGALREEILNEKVMSAIIECRADAGRVPEIFAALRRVAGEIESVISAAIAARCGPDGSVPYLDMAREAGFTLSLNGKTNIGLGRPRFEERQQAA